DQDVVPLHRQPRAASATGTGRMSTRTAVPGASSTMRALATWATTRTSPGSTTVTRLVGPRKLAARTRPVPSGSTTTSTASGRTRTVTGSAGASSALTSGRVVPNTSTVPSDTRPGSRLLVPTKSATNALAGRWYTAAGGPTW